MAILIDRATKVICQGMTGKQATFHCEQAIAYGTRIVAGVTPGKGGTQHLRLPVYDTVAQAADETGANASLVFVPPHAAAEAMIEAIDAEIPLVVCVTERVPVLDMVRVRRRLEGSQTRLLGPNSQGIIAPEACKIGIMPGHIHTPGRIGILSRSASLTYEAVIQCTRARLGQSTVVGVGGDPVHGLGFVEGLELFLEDPETEAILLIGEIGGTDEEDAAAFLETAKPKKPVLAYVAGRHAPTGRRMGHAGTLTVFGSGEAAGKIEALRAAGVTVIPSAAGIATALRQAYRR